jgi:branched-chain amino acid transport system permease protein
MLGLSSLAASEDKQAAMLRGINTTRLALIAFAFAGGILALLGPVVAAKTYASYNLGDSFAVKAFVAVAIGGFGSYFGAVAGGLTVGVLEMFAARFLGSTWQDIVVFAILLLALVALPNGVTGRTRERTV